MDIVLDLLMKDIMNNWMSLTLLKY